MRAADQVDLVRVRGPSPARQVRHALGRARLSPTSLPPAAVLVVRRLAAPLPGTGRRLPPQWEQATRDAIAEMHRRAVRPWQGHVPPQAEAVLFVDEAERRACAAVAIAAGERPWWAASLGAGTVAEVLGGAPRLAPAALDRLDAWGEAPRVLSAVSAPDAVALLDAVCAAFGVSPSASAAVPAPLPWSDAPALAQTVHDVSRRAGRAQAALLGVGVTFARAAHRLRPPEALDAVRQWAADGDASTAVRPRSREESGPRDADAPQVDSSPRARPSPAPEPPPSTGDGAGSQRPSPPRPPADATAPRPTPEPTPRLALREERAEAAQEPESGTNRSAVTETTLQSLTDWTDGVATGLGGVLFLLPVMRSAGWPDACEASWRPATQAGSWAVLEALARALLGEADDTHRTDPLWRVLSHLDGRPLEASAHDAIAPPLPPWLSAWARRVLPDVEAQLVEALGLDGPAQIPPALLLREGTVYVTASHVDLVLPLASASLAIRRAGLDADPGWLPRAGRVVLFHYR